MSEYIKTTLSECLSSVIDYRGKTPKKLGSSWSKSGYRALSALNVKMDGLIRLEEINYADEALYQKWMKEEVSRGDILLTSEAPAGQVMIWDSDEKILLSQRLFCLKTKKDVDAWYLKYFFQSDLGQKSILNNNSGSTAIGISAKTFDNISVFLPDLPTQRAISAALRVLDKKIEINRNIIDHLEDIASTIYDYWFVQFDFPDENNRPLLYRLFGRLRLRTLYA